MTNNDFPALNHEPVTERHSRICREKGHATHTVDGKETGICPRCGEVKNEPDYGRENDLLQFADEVVTYMLNELEGGSDWREQFAAMTAEEKKFFFAAIADGFNDTTDN